MTLPAALSTFALCSFTATPVAHAATPAITDLSTLGIPGYDAHAINDAGQIVGSVTDAAGDEQAFSWTAAGGMVSLGTLGGSSSIAINVNDLGQVIGDSATGAGAQHAFSWTAAGGMVDLGTLPGDVTSGAVGVNNNGQVVGYSMDASGNEHSFSWTAAGGMVDLGTLGGQYTGAVSVNDLGQVVGDATTPSGDWRAFSWTAATGIVAIGDSYTEEVGVADTGQVAGWFFDSAGNEHAFSWTSQGGMVDIGTLGGASVGPNAISSTGEVVGIAATASGDEHAFAWTSSGGMVDLGTLGGNMSVASAANPNGEVIGSSLTSSGENDAFSWTPTGGMVDLGGLGFSDSQNFQYPVVSNAQKINSYGDILGIAANASGGFDTVLWPGTHDTTPPVVSGSPDRAPNAAGWYNAPVTVTWSATDPDNPTSDLTIPPPTTAGTEGSKITYTSGQACDPAGNCATGAVSLSLDLTPPTVGAPVLSANPKSISQTSTLTAPAADNLSGVTGGEYFIGADPGVGLGTAMTYSGGTLTATIGTSLDPGVYTVGVRSVDAAGNWSTTSTAILVVYDPSGGFATGGGWIIPGSSTSDPGDNLPGLDGTSKANFGFVVKYQNGSSTVPGGNLQFDYNVGNFHLSSTAMDWLVVTNDNWAHFQGTAGIQGQSGTYPFQVDAYDGTNTGHTDRFSIKIYPAGSDPSTASPTYKASGDVLGGQVVIHSS